MTGWVYFIACEPMGACKIGFTKAAPRARMASLQTGCPSPLKLLAAVPATIEEERSLHDAFRGLHIQGEWFRYELKLRDLVFWLGDEEGIMASRQAFENALHDVLMQDGGWHPEAPYSDEAYNQSGDWEPFRHLLWNAFGPWED
jgi:hypothetical protein